MTETSTAELTDEATSRVVRALLDFRSVWTTRDLVELSEVPTPDVRRIVDELQVRSLVSRTRGGIIAVPDWSHLLNRWAADSPITGASSRWKTRGNLRDLFARIADRPVQHALTGTHAASCWTGAEPEGHPVLYTPNARAAAEAWGLTPSRTGNLILTEPRTAIVYLRRRKSPVVGVRLAAPAQVLADLIASRGKHSTSGAQQLRCWMQTHVLEWRY